MATKATKTPAKYLTSKTANPVKHFCIENTGHKIVVSCSTRTNVGSVIDFLGIPLRVVRDATVGASAPGILATTGKQIPESWFVDLSGEVELTEAAETADLAEDLV